MEAARSSHDKDQWPGGTLVLNDGDGFGAPQAVESLKQSIWGHLQMPAWLSARLTEQALLRAPEHPVRTWKMVLKELRAAAKAKKKPSTLRRFWSRCCGAGGASGQQEITRIQAEELLDAIKIHQAKTRINRAAYRGAGTEDDMRRIYWPNPLHSKRPRSLFDETPQAVRLPLITRSTAIVSAGSCFAMEIAHWLQDNGFNYVVTDPRTSGHRLPISSARWGTIFNAPSFRQLAEHAFGLRSVPKLLWKLENDHGKKIADPFREDVLFDSVEEWEADYEPHRANARKALEKAEIFIMTLGMAEVWFTRHSKFYMSRCNWGLTAELVDRKVLTVEETVQELEAMLGILRQYNPGLKIIVSASPVPLHATFRSEEYSVITANCYSKAVQRLAAEMFASRNEGVFYFPSYESVMYCTRDVSREAVGKVMNLFCDMFVARDG